jgi:rRNA maturation endonuclease Nob1
MFHDHNIPEEETKGKSYDMTYYCDNCKRSFTQTFQYGERASQGICPHCGVGPRYF